jgi:hypothetical protein
MAPVHEEHNKSPTHLTIPRGRILEAENKHTNESRQRGEEKEADPTNAKALCVEGVSQETQEVEKNMISRKKMFLKQTKQILPRIQLCLPPHTHQVSEMHLNKHKNQRERVNKWSCSRFYHGQSFVCVHTGTLSSR